MSEREFYHSVVDQKQEVAIVNKTKLTVNWTLSFFTWVSFNLVITDDTLPFCIYIFALTTCCKGNLTFLSTSKLLLTAKTRVLLMDVIIMTMHFIDFLYECALDHDVFMEPLAWTGGQIWSFYLSHTHVMITWP